MDANRLAGGVLFLENEDPKLFNILLHELAAGHRPVGISEELLVFKMAEYIWFGERAGRLLTQALDRNTREDNTKQVSLMLRYKNSNDRGFHQALTQLLKLQKDRPKQESPKKDTPKTDTPKAESPKPEAPKPAIGSVSQNTEVPIGFVSQNQPIAPRTTHKTGRNELCPCGSGLKFKRCCIDKPRPRC
jgi:hypothetical protein